eukprot:COSAG06_NODE_5902_length_3221_cov_14.117233_6_plen_225_part_00
MRPPVDDMVAKELTQTSVPLASQPTSCHCDDRNKQNTNTNTSWFPYVCTTLYGLPSLSRFKNNHDRFPIGRKLSVLFTWCPDWSTRSVRECTPANDSSGQAPSSPSSGHRTNEQEPASCVRKTHLCLSHLALKMINLPRQARDKQKERRLKKSTGRIVDCARHVDVAIRPARHADTLVKRPFLFCFAAFLSVPSLSGQNDRFIMIGKWHPKRRFPKRHFPHLIV